MEFDLNFYINVISSLISAIGIIYVVAGNTTKVKKLFRAVWKLIISYNDHLRWHRQRTLNFFEEDQETVYGRLIAEGMKIIFKADFGNKDLIAEMKKRSKELKLEIDDTRFYDRKYVSMLIEQEKKRMMQELKLKKLAAKRLKELRKLAPKTQKIQTQIARYKKELKKLSG